MGGFGRAGDPQGLPQKYMMNAAFPLGEEGVDGYLLLSLLTLETCAAPTGATGARGAL